MIEQGKDVLKEIELESIARKHLLAVTWEITSKCNAKCVFCYSKKYRNNKEDSLFWEKIQQIAVEMKNLGVWSIQITGGEPLMRKDIFEILKLFKDLRFRVHLTTNGMLLTPFAIKKLASLRIDEITVSVHTLREKVFEKLWGVKKYFLKKQIENILRMKEAGINVNISVVITKYNINEYLPMEFFWKDKGILNVKWNIVTPGIEDKETLNLTPGVEQLESFYRNLYKNKKINYRIIKFNDSKKITYRCNAGINHLSIDWNGNVYPCTILTRYKVGNIFKDSLKRIWENSKHLQELRKIKDKDYKYCMECSAKDFCVICIGNNYNSTKNLFIPHPVYCRWAKVEEKVFMNMRFRVKQGISYREVVKDNKIIIHNPYNGKTFLLKGAAVEIWKYLEKEMRFKTIYDTLRNKYSNTDSYKIRSHIYKFLTELQYLDLIEIFW